MLNQVQIDNKIMLLRNETAKISENFSNNFEVDNYIDYVNSYSSFTGYTYLNPYSSALKSIPQTIRSRKINQLLKNIESVCGNRARVLYLKMALLFFLRKAVVNLNNKSIPTIIQDICRQWHQRIFDDISTQPDEFYDHSNDHFLKDLAVVSQRAIPVGGAWISQIFRIKLRILLKILRSNPSQFFELLWFVHLKVGGFSPFYDLHMDTRYLEWFNPDGRDFCYSNIAELLYLNPEIKGGCWIGWYNDPSLEVISPRLAYLRQRPVQNGGKTFRIGTYSINIVHATAKSPTRKKLYEEGKYIPSNYMVIWPRKQLIEWAGKHA